MDFLGFLNGSGLTQPAIWIAVAVACVILLRVSNVFRYIPNNQVGIVEKLWAIKGSIEDGFIALNGEAGYEPEVLRGGLHVMFPFMYRIHRSDLVTVGQGKIAYVFARDGAALEPSQVLGANDTEDKSDFQDARRFLLGGGRRSQDRIRRRRDRRTLVASGIGRVLTKSASALPSKGGIEAGRNECRLRANSASRRSAKITR